MNRLCRPHLVLEVSAIFATNFKFMAKSSTRRVTIYINGKEVEASVKQIRSEMNKLVNEQNRMVIGSDEYISHAKKNKELRQYHYKKMYFCKFIAISAIV